MSANVRRRSAAPTVEARPEEALVFEHEAKAGRADLRDLVSTVGSSAPAKRAGLPILRFHDLRHSFGTHAIRAFNIYEVQRMMGHRHITTTERYLHYAPDPDAAAKLSGLWQSDAASGNVVSLRTAAA